MAETDISIAVVAIKADLAQFRKEMAKISPEAGAAAKDMTAAIAKELKNVEKSAQASAKVITKEIKQTAVEAEKAAKATGKSFGDIARSLQQNQAISQAETIAAMFITVGGSVSQVAMLVTSAIRPVATLTEMLKAAFGPNAPIILGLAALPVAGLAAIGMLKGLANSGLEAFHSLEKLHIKVDKEARQAFEEYEGSTKRLAIAMDQLKVSVGSEVADAFADIIEITAFAVEHFEQLENVTSKVSRRGLAMLTLGMSELGRLIFWAGSVANDAFADALREDQREINALIAVQQSHSQALALAVKVTEEYKKKVHDTMVEGMYWREEQEKMLVALGMMVSVEEEDKEKKDALTAATRASAEAERIRGEYLRANEAILRDVGEIQKENTQAYVDSVKGTYQTIDSIDQAYGELLPKLDGISDAFREVAARGQAMRDIGFQIASDMVTTFQTISDAIMNAAKARSDALDQAVQNDRDRISELRQAYRDLAEEYEGIDQQHVANAHAATQAEVARIQERIQARQDEMAEQKKAAQTAYALSQSFAVSQAMISAAQMAIGMAAQLSVFSGVAAVPIAVAASGAMLATQLAAIAAAPPPEFPTGGMVSPDHRVVATRGDEGILAARAVRAVGGPDGVDALNEGATLGSGDGPETVRILRSIREALQPPRGPGVFRAMRGRRV